MIILLGHFLLRGVNPTLVRRSDEHWDDSPMSPLLIRSHPDRVPIRIDHLLQRRTAFSIRSRKAFDLSLAGGWIW
ncbi:hypothetical protein [Methylacidimicrobium sp. B4]|uniref:hypothetical protein n=1 Tax=Methylacidimicrobium sp. B4 TaxID=2796139 RepID=UPI001A8DDB6A|nr:hypothetical protein [Methylacidimicrobium sp. B4]QSR85024.1 hypothetical protein MacB4_01780 [Methylacidimicrobium sp. B4]